eukprot:200605_1
MSSTTAPLYIHDIYLVICNDYRNIVGHTLHTRIENGILWFIALYVGNCNFKYIFMNKLKNTKTNVINNANDKDSNEYDIIGNLGYNTGNTFKIKAADYKPGTIAYIGNVENISNVMGVSLNLWPSDGTNGTYNGKKYFNAPQNKGLFIHAMEMKHNNSYCNGLIIYGPMLNGKRVIKDNVKYCSQFSLENGFIDIELLQLSTQNSKYLFEIKSNDALSLRVRNLQINDRIELFRGIKGTVKYIGGVTWTEGEIIGLQLDEVIGNSIWMRRYFRRTEIKSIFGKNWVINGQQFILEIDVKNCQVNIKDVCNVNNQWSMKLNQKCMRNARIVFYLRGGAKVNLMHHWWQSY